MNVVDGHDGSVVDENTLARSVLYIEVRQYDVPGGIHGYRADQWVRASTATVDRGTQRQAQIVTSSVVTTTRS